MNYIYHIFRIFIIIFSQPSLFQAASLSAASFYNLSLSCSASLSLYSLSNYYFSSAVIYCQFTLQKLRNFIHISFFALSASYPSKGVCKRSRIFTELFTPFKSSTLAIWFSFRFRQVTDVTSGYYERLVILFFLTLILVNLGHYFIPLRD